jgi:hypothetical protein
VWAESFANRVNVSSAWKTAIATALTSAMKGSCVGDDQAEGEGEPPPPDPEGPRVLSISSNRTSIGEGESVVVSAVVTDPQGIDDVIGGTLLDPTNDATYGTFATSAAEGAYEIVVTWDDFNAVRPLTFDEQDQRTLRARFFDASGNEAFADLRITLTCGGASACQGNCDAIDCNGTCTSPSPGLFDRCGGVCMDLNTEPNCGACGNSCADGGCGTDQGEGYGCFASTVNQSDGYLQITLATSPDRAGLVCDDEFGIEEASVACRQLGTPSNNPTFATVSAPIGTPIVIDDVVCVGDEEALDDCSFRQFNNCNANEAVLVTCN